MRFVQFTLRQLFVLFFAVAVFLSMLVPGWQKQRGERQRAEAGRNLLDTVAAGDVDGAARAIAAGADLHDWRLRRSTLSGAVQRRDLPIVDLLLNAGTEPDVSLHIPVTTNDLPLARRLLEAGADPNRRFDEVGTGPGYRRGPLDYCIHNGRLPMMTLLLDWGADVEQGGQSGPPLVLAIRCEQPIAVRLQMIRLLIERGANPQKENWSRNLMDEAFDRSAAEVGDLLRTYGLPYGPREMAAFNRLDELKRVIQKNPGVLKERFKPIYGEKPGRGPTLLRIAIERGYREMVRFLIESGATLDSVEIYERTLLHLACGRDDPEMIRMLVARGLNVNARDESQETPLTDCARAGRPETIRALLAAGADVNGAVRAARHYMPPRATVVSKRSASCSLPGRI